MGAVGRRSGCLLLRALALLAGLACGGSETVAATTEYYFNYDADSDGGIILDETGNLHDLFPLFLGDFQFAPLTSGLPLVGSARAFDVAATLDDLDGIRRGAITDRDPFDETDLIAAGGYTFETWLRREANDGLSQHIWNPEGMHSLEILGNANPANQQLQFAIRGLAAWTLPVNNVLPPGQWHHVMAVMTTTNGVGGVNYRLLVNGTPIGPVLSGNLFSSFTTLAARMEGHGIGGSELGGAENAFHGQLAYTRLSLGTLSYAQSLAFARNIPGFGGGDFNQDQLLNCADVDSLVAAIAAGGNPSAFDLNGDSRVDTGDLAQWLSTAGATNLPSGRAYLFGDANLDGVVDGSDFGIWNANKFTAAAAWCRGDFTANGGVDGSDFGIWNANKFRASDQVGSLVPEPFPLSALGCVLLGIIPRFLWVRAR